MSRLPIISLRTRKAATIAGGVVGGLLVLAKGSVVAPFIYTLF